MHLNPQRPNAPGGAVLSAWQTSSTLAEAEKWLRETLQDLESRGLLQWDRAEKKYDLHPVVRGYAVSSVPADQREGVAQKLVDYFDSLPHAPWDDATTFSDLQNGLHVARTQLHLGRFEEATSTLLDLSQALIFNLEAYDEYLALLRPIFSDGWQRPAPGIEGLELSAIWKDVAICMENSGLASESLKIYENILLLDIGLDWLQSVPLDLRNLSSYLNDVNHVFDGTRVMTLLEEATAALGNEEDLVMDCMVSLHSAAHRGDFVTAERFAAQFAASTRPTARAIYRPGDYEFWLAKLHFFMGRLDEAALAEVEKLAKKGNNRRRIRPLHNLVGEWRLSLGQWVEAAVAFEEAIRMAREVNLSSSDSEARLALTQVKLGWNQSARETAVRLSELEDPPHVSLAELYLALGDPALGDLEKARRHVLPAYKRAWADGEPYVDWWPLQRCRKVLQALGDPEPQLPKFDPANFEPLPYEAAVLEYIEKKKKPRDSEPRP